MTTSKSLNEIINEVLASKGSKKAKIDAIVKIGVPVRDAQMVVDIYTKDNPREPKTRYTFGVELECNVPWQSVINDNNAMFKYAGYTHVNERTMFKFVTDVSVVGENSIECVSPILNVSTTGFNTMKKACKALNDKGATVNNSCGYHVHIGAEGMTDKQYINFFVNYAHCEKVIDSFMAKSRRENNAYYCKSIRGFLNGLATCTTKEDVQRLFGHGHITDWRQGARYYKVNPMAYVGHKTLEIRHHQGTTDYTKVSNWVKFNLALVEFSKNHRLSADINSIDELTFITTKMREYYKGRKVEVRG
ncbi:MAG: amidoligase family protein [Prevotella sp.]|nr:amidoligase family protein [Candidatus Prevotella equi]